jgi:twitching motility two-component system response regulator PilG
LAGNLNGNDLTGKTAALGKPYTVTVDRKSQIVIKQLPDWSSVPWIAYADVRQGPSATITTSNGWIDMADKRILTVAEIGLFPKDQLILKSIMRLSTVRPVAYRLIDFDRGNLPNILLVNGENPAAIDIWHAAGRSDPSVQSIIITSDEANVTHPHSIRGPIVASRVLIKLDQIAIRFSAIDTPETNPQHNPGHSDSAAQMNGPEDISHGRFADAWTTLRRPVGVNAKPTERLTRSAQNTGGHIHVLVVDDSMAVRKQMEIQLREHNVRLDLAETGSQAFTSLDQNTYDLIFLDVVLPDTDGYKICKQIKKKRAIRKTPVVMLTSKSSPFDKFRGKIAGCNTYLTKPIDPSILQETIRKYTPPH